MVLWLLSLPMLTAISPFLWGIPTPLSGQPQGGHMTTCGELHSSSWNVYFGENKEKGAKWYEVTDFRGCLSHGSWTPMQATGWSAEPPALPAFPAAQGAYSLPANCTGLGPAGQFQTTCGTYTHLAQALGLGGLG